MNVSDNLLRHVKGELEKLEYGSVTIEVVGGKSMDVITQVRKRFPSRSCEEETTSGKHPLVSEHVPHNG